MDDSKGHLQPIPEGVWDKLIKEYPQGDIQAFREGEILTIKGSRFKVQGIRPKKLILKILPHEMDGFYRDDNKF